MSEEVYRHRELPGVVLRVSVERSMGDTDVDLRVEVGGALVYQESDPHVGGMAFSRDRRWLYVQTGFGHDVRHRTFDMADRQEVEGRLHPSDASSYVLASDFVRGGHRLGEVGEGRFAGSAFEPIHPMRTAAETMTDSDRLATLDLLLALQPTSEVWQSVAGVFERWQGPSCARGLAEAHERLAGWPTELRTKPVWLDRLDTHPLWSLVTADETRLTIASRPVSAEVLARVLARPSMRHLDILELTRCRVDDEGAQVIASSPSVRFLRALSLYGNPIRDAGARALAESPNLGNLTSLDLNHTEVSAAAFAELRRSSRLPHLERLYGDRGPVEVRAAPRPSPKRTPAAQPFRPSTVHDCVPGLEDALVQGTFDEVDRFGRTMLFRAVAPFGGCLQCTRRLIEAGADVNFRSSSGLSVVDELRSAVSSALENETANKIEALLRGAGYRDSG